MSTAVEGQTQPVLLMLVDISGYTRFMVEHAKELRHSETIIRELMESLIEQVDVGRVRRLLTTSEPPPCPRACPSYGSRCCDPAGSSCRPGAAARPRGPSKAV